MRLLALSFLGVIFALGSTLAQDAASPALFRSRTPDDNVTTSAKVELGRQLFNSGDLSETGNVSCATCHDPNKGFSDSRSQAVGVAGFPVGRNSAALTATGLVDRFPGIEQVRSKDKKRVVSTRPTILTLEERCLAPIANAVEMGSSVTKIVKSLRRKQGMNRSFDRAFDSKVRGGVTEKRLGQALAAYLRTLEPARNAPYRRYLEGDTSALTHQQEQGLEVFNGRGQCNRCHSGPALSDGLVHLAALPTGKRTVEQTRANRKRVRKLSQMLRGKKATGRKKKQLEAQMKILSGGGVPYYGPNPQIGGQTPPLWNVTQTAPYFRDGSSQDLRSTVVKHIDELQEVALAERQRREAVRNQGTRRFNLMSRITAPREIRANWRTSGPVLPDDLDPEELANLLAFLKAL